MPRPITTYPGIKAMQVTPLMFHGFFSPLVRRYGGRTPTLRQIAFALDQWQRGVHVHNLARDVVHEQGRPHAIQTWGSRR
jgi:hypothetical protein